VKVGVSAGIVSTMRISVATEVATLIQHAIEAVAHAKRDGGNQSYMVFV
jgi:hypothetical protein